MSAHRRARRSAIAFFILYAVAVTFPGVVPFRGPRPFILGVPLALAWTAAWVVASLFVLVHLDRAYSAAERAANEDSDTPET